MDQDVGVVQVGPQQRHPSLQGIATIQRVSVSEYSSQGQST